MRRFLGAYVSSQLILLVIALAWIAIGGINWAPSIPGAAVVGAIVSLVRDWAGEWKGDSKKASLMWIVLGALVLAITASFADKPMTKWPLRASMLSAAAMGMGIAGLAVSMMQNSGDNKKT